MPSLPTIANRAKLLVIPGHVRAGEVRSSRGPHLAFSRDGATTETDRHGASVAVAADVPAIDFDEKGRYQGMRASSSPGGPAALLTEDNEVYLVQSEDGQSTEVYLVQGDPEARDEARVSSSDVEAVWREESMSLFVSYRMDEGEGARTIFEMRESPGDRMELVYRGDDDGRLELSVFHDGIGQTIPIHIEAVEPGVILSLTVTMGERIRGFFAGEKVFDEPLAALPSPAELKLGYGEGNDLHGHIRALALFDFEIPEAEAVKMSDFGSTMFYLIFQGFRLAFDGAGLTKTKRYYGI